MLDPKKILAALGDQIEGNPHAMMLMARTMTKTDMAQAAILARRALAAAPGDPEIAMLAREVFSSHVPAWHFNIVRDHVRNDAYEAALRRAIRPGMRVLEIGTGSGILAMMAARCGAEVITCEMNPVMAETAQEIVARNGYADRVRVIGRRSDTLEAERDLGGRMDLLVSEILSNDMLSEGVIPAHAHAVTHLLKPGAPVIPARGSVQVALVELAEEDEQQVGISSGFDLSPLNALRKPRRIMHRKQVPVMRSAAAELFAFDFADTNPAPTRRTSVELVSLGGRINGIVQWIRLEMDAEGTYENPPGSVFDMTWGVKFHPLPQAMETRAADVLTIGGRHNDKTLDLWLAGAG